MEYSMKRWIALAVLFAAPVLTAQAPPVPDDLPDSTESVVLTGIKTCTNVDAAKGKPSGCKKRFRSSQKIHVFAAIRQPGTYTVNARFELQDSTRRNKPINVEIKTKPNWTFLHFWMTPNKHDDKFVGPWKATIYVHDAAGHTTEYNAQFEVTEG